MTKVVIIVLVVLVFMVVYHNANVITAARGESNDEICVKIYPPYSYRRCDFGKVICYTSRNGISCMKNDTINGR